MEAQQKQITVSAVLACLQEGMLRREMAAHFGISQSELARHFRHPTLRGRRPKGRPGSVLVDDTVDKNQPELSFPVETAEAEKARASHGTASPYGSGINL